MKHQPLTTSSILSLGALFAAISVALGAFGAHALSESLSPKSLNTWHTATDYLQFHALGLLLIGTLQRLAQAVTSGQSRQTSTVFYSRCAWLITVGCVLFSGSLYSLALGAPRGLAFLTPLGGVCFISAWLWLAAGLWRAPSSDSEHTH